MQPSMRRGRRITLTRRWFSGFLAEPSKREKTLRLALSGGARWPVQFAGLINRARQKGPWQGDDMWPRRRLHRARRFNLIENRGARIDSIGGSPGAKTR